MRTPRALQYDHTAPPFLHVISRCVRRAFLCGDGCDHRRLWIERRLELLASCFAMDVAGYAIMSNHVHLVVRPSPDRIKSWSDQRIARAWLTACMTMEPDGSVSEPHPNRIDAALHQPARLAVWRERLGSLSWFMKALKEPISRMANIEDDCTGTFWEGRFQSIPLLDQAAIISCLAYVDLNPIRAGLATTPEESDHTSIAHRIRIERLDEEYRDDSGGTNGQRLTSIHHQACWLVSIAQATSAADCKEGMTLGNYLQLVDATGRGIAEGKSGHIPTDLPAILHRLAIDSEAWMRSMERPRSLLGTALGSAEALAREALRRGRNWLQQRSFLFKLLATD